MKSGLIIAAAITAVSAGVVQTKPYVGIPYSLETQQTARMIARETVDIAAAEFQKLPMEVQEQAMNERYGKTPEQIRAEDEKNCKESILGAGLGGGAILGAQAGETVAAAGTGSLIGFAIAGVAQHAICEDHLFEELLKKVPQNLGKAAAELPNATKKLFEALGKDIGSFGSQAGENLDKAAKDIPTVGKMIIEAPFKAVDGIAKGVAGGIKKIFGD